MGVNLTGGRREQTTEQQSSGNDSGSSTRTSISSSMEVEVDVEVARAIGWGWLDACSEVEATTTIATDQPAQPARWSPSGGHSSNASPPRATGGRRTGGGSQWRGGGWRRASMNCPGLPDALPGAFSQAWPGTLVRLEVDGC